MSRYIFTLIPPYEEYLYYAVETTIPMSEIEQEVEMIFANCTHADWVTIASINLKIWISPEYEYEFQTLDDWFIQQKERMQ